MYFWDYPARTNGATFFVPFLGTTSAPKVWSKGYNGIFIEFSILVFKLLISILPMDFEMSTLSSHVCTSYVWTILRGPDCTAQFGYFSFNLHLATISCVFDYAFIDSGMLSKVSPIEKSFYKSYNPTNRGTFFASVTKFRYKEMVYLFRCSHKQSVL